MAPEVAEMGRMNTCYFCRQDKKGVGYCQRYQRIAETKSGVTLFTTSGITRKMPAHACQIQFEILDGVKS